MKKIIDCERNFVDAECVFCGRKGVMIEAWVSGGSLQKRNACKSCVHKNTHPKDWKVLRTLWEGREIRNLTYRCRKEMDDLCERHPNRRFFFILRELTANRFPAKIILYGIHRFWLGETPTPKQYTAITKMIRSYRNVRLGYRIISAPLDRRRAEMPLLHSGTGSCGFF